MNTKVARALTIAGSDPGGGAGIQADLKTFLALGVHGMSAITALTAQNTLGVSGIHEVPPDFVREQIAQLASDIGVDAAKTGMLSSAAIVEAVADAVTEFGIDRLVVDPVFIAKSGDRLLAEEAVDALRTKLLPLALVVTPNLHEAGGLTGRKVETLDDMRTAAEQIAGYGPRTVLVKGGHLEGPDAVDIGFDVDGFFELRSPRVDSKNTHGTGCTLSAAIAAELAKGATVRDALAEAKRYLQGAIRDGLPIGAGAGPTNHGWESTIRRG